MMLSGTSNNSNSNSKPEKFKPSFSISNNDTLIIKEKKSEPAASVRFSDIVLLKSENHLTQLMGTANNRLFETAFSLTQLMTELENYGFVQANRTVVINRDFVTRFDGDKMEVHVKHYHEFTVTFRRKKYFTDL